MNADALDLSRLDLAQLALFVGQAADTALLSQLHARGFSGLRTSHGYLVQHVVHGERSISELATRMGVSQQAASKSVRELVDLGYFELVRGADARQRLVRLSTRGKSALRAARRLRAALERRLLKGHPREAIATARAIMVVALERMNASEAVRTRTVLEPV